MPLNILELRADLAKVKEVGIELDERLRELWVKDDYLTEEDKPQVLATIDSMIKGLTDLKESIQVVKVT